MSNWESIWAKRKPATLSDTKLSQIELIELNGFDHPGILNLPQWIRWFSVLKKEKYLDLDIHSVYEIGCGSGAFLNYFSEFDKIGGCDYSESLLEVAKKQLPHAEFERIPGNLIDVGDKFDNLSSFSVFQYMTHKEAREVLDKALIKADRSIYIFDVPLESVKEDCEKFRKSLDMKESFHTYYLPEFFEIFAETHDLKIEMEQQNIPGYLHDPYRFNVYLYKNI